MVQTFPFLFVFLRLVWPQSSPFLPLWLPLPISVLALRIHQSSSPFLLSRCPFVKLCSPIGRSHLARSSEAPKMASFPVATPILPKGSSWRKTPLADASLEMRIKAWYDFRLGRKEGCYSWLRPDPTTTLVLVSRFCARVVESLDLLGEKGVLATKSLGGISFGENLSVRQVDSLSRSDGVKSKC